jgi:hypothetical protein
MPVEARAANRLMVGSSSPAVCAACRTVSAVSWTQMMQIAAGGQDVVGPGSTT